MKRKPYRVSLAAPRCEHATIVQLTDEEADVVRFVAEELVKVAATDGTIDSLDVEEAA